MHTLETLFRTVAEQLSTNESAGPLLLLCLTLVKGAIYETGKQIASVIWRWLAKRGQSERK